MRLSTVILPSLALVGLAPNLAAQSQAATCAALSSLTVGQWAQYEVTGSDIPGGASEMTMAIIGTEQADGAEHYWFEIRAGTEMGNMIMQVLVPDYPYEPDEIRGAIMKMGNQPAMRMPQQMIGMMNSEGDANPADNIVEECEQAESVGWENVTVPAGTIRALHMLVPEPEGGDAWISADVPFGLVRMNGPDFQMSLKGHGDDATSSIDEEPQAMPGMN